MERFVQGDTRAFEALFDRYGPKVHGFVGRMVSDASMVDDLVQTTFLSVVRARGRYERGQRFAPWIFAIAANATRDALRRRQRRREVVGDDRSLAALAAPAPVEPDAERDRQVSAALSALPEPQREAVVLHWFHGLSFREIAASRGTTPGAVKVRAHRGYERLRLLLGNLAEDLE
jgi:RNA polymerase sigma-70 factor (ECF subfamily)